MKNKKILYMCTFVGVCIIALMIANTTTYATSGKYGIDDFIAIFGEDSSVLEIDKMFTDIVRSIGNVISVILMPIHDALVTGFNVLMTWDIMSLSKIKIIEDNLSLVIGGTMVIALVIVGLSVMTSMKSDHKVIYNILMTGLLISCFTILSNMTNDAKNNFVDIGNDVVGTDKNVSISEAMYKENTIDILSSLDQGKVVRLSDIADFNIQYYEHDERMTRKQLVQRYYYNGSTLEKEDLADGMFGVGDVRYYRYNTNYMSLNSLLVVNILVYFMAMFKLAHLIWSRLETHLLGRFAMLKGFWDLSNVGKFLSTMLKVYVSYVVLNLQMNIFTNISSSIVNDTTLNAHWFIPPILIYGMGVGIAMGSTIINQFLGLDDGGSLAMKSVVTMGLLSRTAKKAKRSASNMVGSGKDAVKSTYGTSKKAYDGVRNLDKQNKQLSTDLNDAVNQKMDSIPKSGNSPMSDYNTKSQPNAQTKKYGAHTSPYDAKTDGNDTTKSNNGMSSNQDIHDGINAVKLSKDGIQFKDGYKNAVMKEKMQKADDDAYKSKYRHRAEIREDVHNEMKAEKEYANQKGFGTVKEYNSWKDAVNESIQDFEQKGEYEFADEYRSWLEEEDI